MTELVYCVTIAFTNRLPFKSDFRFGEVARSQIWALDRLTDLGDVMLCQKKSPHESFRMGRRIASLYCVYIYIYIYISSNYVKDKINSGVALKFLEARAFICSLLYPVTESYI